MVSLNLKVINCEKTQVNRKFQTQLNFFNSKCLVIANKVSLKELISTNKTKTNHSSLLQVSCRCLRKLSNIITEVSLSTIQHTKEIKTHMIFVRLCNTKQVLVLRIMQVQLNQKIQPFTFQKSKL